MTDLESLRTAQEAVDVAQEAMGEAVRVRDATVQAARANGLPVAAITEALGVDRQIVYRILRR